MRAGRRKSRKLVNRVLVTHGCVALGTDGTQVANVRSAPLALRNVVTDVKIKRVHDVCTPRHEALVLEQTVPAIKKPYLLTQRTWNLSLHIIK